MYPSTAGSATHAEAAATTAPAHSCIDTSCITAAPQLLTQLPEHGGGDKLGHQLLLPPRDAAVARHGGHQLAGGGGGEQQPQPRPQQQEARHLDTGGEREGDTWALQVVTRITVLTVESSQAQTRVPTSHMMLP